MPKKEVFIDSFYISKFEITVKQYNQYLESIDKAIIKDEANYPITNITWNEAKQYCDWLSKITGENYRLPHEVEWEIAAKGGQEQCYPWGNEMPSENSCNFLHTGIYMKDFVDKSYNVSKFGNYNMSGNAAEWCVDWYYFNYYDIIQDYIDHGKVINLPHKSNFKVIRGGSYKDIAFDVRCTSRKQVDINTHENNIGFRIVKLCLTKN